MQRIRLGRTNVEVPAIGVGTWAHGGTNVDERGEPVGWSGHDDTEAAAALVAAWEHGLTHWDTADVYGDGRAEALIGGLWNRVPRGEIFLASKVGWDPGGYPHPYHPDLVRRRLERSLALLRTEVIDLYYLHHCDFGPGDRYLDGALEQLHRAREEGKIRFLGLSDWEPARVAHLAPRVDPDVVQPFRNVVDDTYASSGLAAWVEAHDAGVAFFSPLKHGLLLGKYEAPVTFPEGDFRARIGEFGDARFVERMRRAREAVARRFPGHPEPVLHALTGVLLADSPHACVLLGQRNPRHVAAAARVGDALSPDDAAWVRRLYRGETELAPG
ncbi:MAG TPA: aldo/keto reductase [Thermoanaerobaculia bacterium]|nr:aldo/keto reductase [Thermoanaerobaculia bacterium]